MLDNTELKFYISPTIITEPRGSAIAYFEAMLMNSYRRGWFETSTTYHGKAAWNKIKNRILIPYQERASLQFAACVCDYMTEQGFLAATAKFNNETHPWKCLEDITEIPKLLEEYTWQKEYIIGVRTWEDIQIIIKQKTLEEAEKD